MFTLESITNPSLGSYLSLYVNIGLYLILQIYTSQVVLLAFIGKHSTCNHRNRNAEGAWEFYSANAASWMLTVKICNSDARKNRARSNTCVNSDRLITDLQRSACAKGVAGLEYI